MEADPQKEPAQDAKKVEKAEEEDDDFGGFDGDGGMNDLGDGFNEDDAE